VSDVQDILHFAEFGVVLMLFLVGLELEPRPVGDAPADLRLGQAQVLGCAALLAAWPWRWACPGAVALVARWAGAVVHRDRLGDGRAQPDAHSSGRRRCSVLLFQDVAAIPILALLPLLGDCQADVARRRPFGGWEAAKALGLWSGPSCWAAGCCCARRCAGSPAAHARDLHRRRAAAGGGHRGADAVRWAVDGAGRLPGRRAAGRQRVPRELETDLEPFKGLLLGLFFIAVGMSIDFGVLARAPGRRWR
jgi:glutathione-regulated potassium-efflux system ancillary protein KefC